MQTYEVEVATYHAFLIKAENEEAAKEEALSRADNQPSIYEAVVLDCDVYETDVEELFESGLVPYTPYVKPQPVTAPEPTGYSPYMRQQTQSGYRFYAA
jgi:hypothetical protein